jgi:hypothetical protein
VFARMHEASTVSKMVLFMISSLVPFTGTVAFAKTPAARVSRVAGAS